MNDAMPLWARLLRIIGCNVSQEFHVMALDSQKTIISWTTGMPTRKDAEDRCDKTKGQWVRRVIEVWKD